VRFADEQLASYGYFAGARADFLRRLGRAEKPPFAY